MSHAHYTCTFEHQSQKHFSGDGTRKKSLKSTSLVLTEPRRLIATRLVSDVECFANKSAAATLPGFCDFYRHNHSVYELSNAKARNISQEMELEKSQRKVTDRVLTKPRRPIVEHTRFGERRRVLCEKVGNGFGIALPTFSTYKKKREKLGVKMLFV